MNGNHSTGKMRFGAVIRPTVLVIVIATLTLGGCTDNAEREPTTAEINAYFDGVTIILSRAYARAEQLVRIFDDESYTEGLSINSRRFKEGAEALRGVNVPSKFDDEHAAYVEALDTIADQLTANLRRIDNGEDVSAVIASDIEGPLADAFQRQTEACKQLARQAEEFEVYDAISCGGDPYFIEAVEPPWSHRVFVNTCCGGSDPLSNPLDIFYGSDEPWERTLAHYEREMKKRGFESPARGPAGTFSKPDRPGECFSIKEYHEENLPAWVEASDVADLDRYAYGYVTGYTMVCGG